MMPPFSTVIILQAIDWGVYGEQIPSSYDFEVVKGWICGFLIEENDDAYVIAHHQFEGGDLRHVTVIPKSTVQEIIIQSEIQAGVEDTE